MLFCWDIEVFFNRCCVCKKSFRVALTICCLALRRLSFLDIFLWWLIYLLCYEIGTMVGYLTATAIMIQCQLHRWILCFTQAISRFVYRFRAAKVEYMTYKNVAIGAFLVLPIDFNRCPMVIIESPFLVTRQEKEFIANSFLHRAIDY